MHNKRAGMANYVWKVFILDYLIVLSLETAWAQFAQMKRMFSSEDQRIMTRMSDKDIFERVVFEFPAQQILTKDADKCGMFVRSLPEEWTTPSNQRAGLRHHSPIRGQDCRSKQ